MFIKVKVFPGEKEENVTEISPNRFEVETRKDTGRNMANMDVIRLIAKHFSLPVNKVRVVTGHHARSKILAIDTDEAM